MTDLVLVEDAVARDWAPFTLTRPAGELLFGAFTQRARLERVLDARCAGYLGCPELLGFAEPDAPPVLTQAPAGERECVFLGSRVVPDWRAKPDWPEVAAAITVAGRLAGWYAPAGSPAPDPAAFAALGGDPPTGAVLSLPGRWLTNVWELVGRNAAQIAADLEHLGATASPAAVPAGLHTLAYQPGQLQLGRDVVIEPGAVFDFTDGPIRLEGGVTVRAFTRLAGPAWVGPGSVLLGGPYAHVSIGPRCKVHGELEASVVLGYSNKAHDGFLGHAYLGRWVNLGAMTTNSDLKNNYGTVRLWTPRGSVDTGEMKVGALLGDHVKTGIGALLNTGTVVGAGSNLFGTAMPPKYVPPFSWGSGAELERYDIEKFLATAEVAMERRQVQLDAGMKQLLRAAWQRSASAGA